MGVPRKLPKGYDRHRDILLPEQCVATDFEEGERVWAARDNAPAKVIREHNPAYQAKMAGMKEFDYEEKYGAKGYAIYVYEEVQRNSDWWYELPAGGTVGHYSFALAYDLGSLRHLEKYGVSF